MVGDEKIVEDIGQEAFVSAYKSIWHSGVHELLAELGERDPMRNEHE